MKERECCCCLLRPADSGLLPAVADADGIITNDGGTMRQTTAATFSTYFNQNLVEVKSLATIP